MSTNDIFFGLVKMFSHTNPLEHNGVIYSIETL